MRIVVLAIVAAHHNAGRTSDGNSTTDAHQNIAFRIGVAADEPVSRVFEQDRGEPDVVALEKLLCRRVSAENNDWNRFIREGDWKTRGRNESILPELIVADGQLSCPVRRSRDCTEGLPHVVKQL